MANTFAIVITLALLLFGAALLVSQPVGGPDENSESFTVCDTYVNDIVDDQTTTDTVCYTVVDPDCQYKNETVQWIAKC